MHITLWLITVALLFAGAAVWLWQQATGRSRQDVSAVFVNQQIQGRNRITATVPLTQDATPRDVQTDALRHFLLRAGIQTGTKKLCIQLIVPGLLLSAIAFLFGGVLSGLGTVVLYVLLVRFGFWRRTSRLQQRMVRQLPGFIDALVRLVTIGNSIGAAFQTAIVGADGPIRVVLDRANWQVQAGVDLELALRKEAQLFRFKELDLMAAVIGVAARFGGRSDQVLDRMAAFMRDLEHAQNELSALSTEIRLSAWIMGLMPVGIGIFLIIFNNSMFTGMWHDPVGKQMLLGAVVLQIVGGFWLYKLAKSM
ncbi:type II secretion system F family protein [Glaciimonas immobilis]|uniref:Tight adherence protein B n=1 Tax=Glaciimonas immobilis TaxID=728004 RepID=A0A840RNH5_9BURK|nr:type II secretion system F family protein [Glaciimonas immobilis]KAF3998826.1 pilus assembly protein TadB [Glaciimonas immobilis]MBB5198210.1 tight adherence protein B [Glaciimonas immobilis]